MKINHKVLSLPPYVSTSWKNISMLAMENGSLVILLNNGSKISVPGLEEQIITEIFSAHERYIENDPLQEKKTSTEKSDKAQPFSFGIPFDMDSIGTMSEGFGAMMQHNPSQANMPNLPKEMLEKVTQVAESLGLTKETSHLPKAEPHCNCMYCQIARAILSEEEMEQSEEIEEEVDDDELTFREWDIEELGEKRYKVSNPINTKESYQVYLGSPLGCTCGMENCEHIRAVLNS